MLKHYQKSAVRYEVKKKGGELPLVSAFVGCYNHSRFIVQTLESVRLQNYPEIELIIWDDFSGDDSVDIIKSWISGSEMDCTFIPHESNIGICKSLNEALFLSKGKYIAMVAGDDIWATDRIARQVEIMENLNEDYGVLYSDAFQIDDNGEFLPKNFIESHRDFNLMPEGMILDELWEGNFIPGMTTLIRRKCFEIIGSYDEKLAYEDWDMWLRIAGSFQFKYDPIPSAYYRILNNSLLRNPAHYERLVKSDKLIFLKHFRNGTLPGSKKMEAIEYLRSEATEQYAMGSPDGKVLMDEARPHYKSVKLTYLAICCQLGIPYSFANRILSARLVNLISVIWSKFRSFRIERSQL